MNKIISAFVIIMLGCSTVFSYELSSKDKQKIQEIEPVLEKLYSMDYQRFEYILNLVNTAIPSSKQNTRSYEIMSEIQIIMNDIVSYEDIPGETEQEVMYTLIKVVDGDTVVLSDSLSGKNISYRLIGIDAPESSALRYGEVEAYGEEAKNYLTEISAGNNISVEYDNSQGRTDKYDRHLVYLFSGSKNLNQEMIAHGYAKEYTYNKDYKYQSDFKKAEAQAQENKSGIWGGEETESSHVYSGFSDTQSDGVCNIKGNISSKGEKIYHYEGCQSYTRTKISPEKGEQYFCSTQEAEKAGWRVAGNCY